MELRLTTQIDELRSAVIDFNNEQLKSELVNALNKYKGLTYDDNSITIAKKDRAGLNTLKNQIDGLRKSVKTEWNEPYVVFEQKVKELLALVDEPIQAIDAQVKDYEQRQKADKRNSLEAYFNTTIGNNASLLKFDDIFNEKWLNVTFTEAKAVEEIKAIITQFNNDLEIISNESGEYKTQLYDYFLRTRDLAATFKEKQRLIATKEAMEQLKAREAERKAKEAEEVQKAAPIAETQPTTAQPDKPQLIAIRFEVEGTAEQLTALSNYLKTNNLTYRRI